MSNRGGKRVSPINQIMAAAGILSLGSGENKLGGSIKDGGSSSQNAAEGLAMSHKNT